MSAKLRAARALPLLLVLALALVGSGGDDDDDPVAVSTPTTATEDSDAEPESDETADSGSDEPASGGEAGEAGFVNINGTTLGINEVRRCEPFFGGEDDLDLQALGQGLQAFIVINRPISSSPLVEQALSIQGGNAGGVFTASAWSQDGESWTLEETDPLPGPPFEVAGNVIRGSLLLSDARGSGETRTVSFEVAIPEEIIDC
jgi:hypothetical protein